MLTQDGTWLGMTNGGWKEQPEYLVEPPVGAVERFKSFRCAQFYLELCNEVEECIKARLERRGLSHDD